MILISSYTLRVSLHWRERSVGSRMLHLDKSFEDKPDPGEEPKNIKAD